MKGFWDYCWKAFGIVIVLWVLLFVMLVRAVDLLFVIKEFWLFAIFPLFLFYLAYKFDKKVTTDKQRGLIIYLTITLFLFVFFFLFFAGLFGVSAGLAEDPNGVWIRHLQYAGMALTGLFFAQIVIFPATRWGLKSLTTQKKNREKASAI